MPVQPAAPTGEQPSGDAQPTEQAIPAPEKVTPEELDRRKQIAEDPSKSNETVVLPVENGAAVLDSDKDADRAAGRGGRRERDRLRAAEQQVIAAPKSDADAQLAPEGQRRPPVKFEAVTSEEGRRLDRRPEFMSPEGARVERYEGDDNRTIIQYNNRIVVRSDDDRRFLRDGERPLYEQLSRDRYRETIERPEGYRIVTIRNRYGDIIQRSRIDGGGREYVLYYSPELYDDPDRGYFEDPGADLPPMRLGIPVRDYIIDTSSNPDRDYYEFLSEPPVEPVERVYSLNEVKYSARIRDKVRRIDLDTITFATGSAEIPMSQAQSLRKVADAMNEVLQKDQSETFLIEGHTDAVGSDQSESRPFGPACRIGRQRADGRLWHSAGKSCDAGLWRALSEGQYGWSGTGKPPRDHSPRHGSGAPGRVEPVRQSARGENAVARAAAFSVFASRRKSDLGGDEIGDLGRVVEIEDRQIRVRDGMVGGDGADMRIGRCQRIAPGRFQAAGFDLRDRFALVAFDQYQVAGSEACEDFLEGRFGGAAQLMHDGITGAGDDRHLMRAGLPVAVAVGADLVDIEIVVGVLDRRDAVAAAGELLDETYGKARLARILSSRRFRICVVRS